MRVPVDVYKAFKKLRLDRRHFRKVHRKTYLEDMISYHAFELYGHSGTQRQKDPHFVAVPRLTLAQNETALGANVAKSSGVSSVSILVFEVDQQAVPRGVSPVDSASSIRFHLYFLVCEVFCIFVAFTIEVVIDRQSQNY
jgi:hypothetical protein